MLKSIQVSKVISLAAVVSFLAATGCEQLPGTPKSQGAVIGGAGGAAAGAAIAGEDKRLVGALIGGALGAAGGYLIGANKDRITGHDQKGAEESVRTAQASPATPEQARVAPTGDINGDGFVTMDEVIALRAAGFSDPEILDRLRATGQVFELTAEQQQYLHEHGVSNFVVSQMMELNRDVRDRLATPQGGVISRPPS